MELDISVDAAALAKRMGIAAKQIEYSSVLAATQLARLVQAKETLALPNVLDRPTPFTMNAFGMKGATKASPQAEVFAKQTQAKYLAPSEFGGEQVLGNSRKIRTPVDAKLNAYGNLPKGFISRRTAGAMSTPGPRGFFIGAVHGVYGLWQRVPGGVKGSGKRVGDRFPNTVKLLIAFTKPVTVKAHLGFDDRARQVVEENYEAIFGDAIARALATAR